MANNEILKELEKYVWFQHKLNANIVLDIIAKFLNYHKRISAYDILYILGINSDNNKLPHNKGWTNIDEIKVIKEGPNFYRIIFPAPRFIESTEGINWTFDF